MSRRHAYVKYQCGDIVREKDGRHEGRVSAIDGFTVLIYWTDPDYLPGVKGPKWKSWFHQDDLELVYRPPEPTTPLSLTRPKTVVESPRRKLERWLSRRRKP